MARSRNIKPSFFTNDILAGCSVAARLLFIGLWTIADREGRLEDRAVRIKAQILPYDDVDCNELLDQLYKTEFIIRYEYGDKKYIQIINFTKHQQPHYKEIASVIPAPVGWIESGITPGGVPESIRIKIIERDGECVQCRAKDDLTLDHIIPRWAGGSHDESNLQTLCRKCNSSKNNKLSSQNQSRANVEPTLSQSNRSMTSLNPLPDSLLPITDSLNPIRRGTRFALSAMPEEYKKHIQEKRPDLNAEEIFEAFKDWWAAQPGQKGVKLDWLATWRTWIRRQEKTQASKYLSFEDKGRAKTEASQREIERRFQNEKLLQPN